MLMREFVNLITEKAEVPVNVISNTIREFHYNLINILSQYLKTEENQVVEARDDIKIYASKEILKTPKNFEVAKITSDNKKNIKAFIVSKKESLKVKESGKNILFKKSFNEVIESLIKTRIDSLLEKSENVKELYDNFIEEVNNEISKNWQAQTASEKRTVGVGPKKKFGELAGIKMIAPNTSTKPKILGGTYYVHEENGPNTFPDYFFYFGKVENEDAKRIREQFNIPKNINKIAIEIKTDTNIVGKQRTPKSFLSSLKNKEIFDKMVDLKVGEETKISLNEVLDILNADGLGVDKQTFYLNPAGATEQAQAKKIRWIGSFKPFKLRRNTPGQMVIVSGGNKTLFRIEIGRKAYENGAFKVKEDANLFLNKLLMEVKNV